MVYGGRRKTLTKGEMDNDRKESKRDRFFEFQSGSRGGKGCGLAKGLIQVQDKHLRKIVKTMLEEESFLGYD